LNVCGKVCFDDDVYAKRNVYRTDGGITFSLSVKAIITFCKELHPKFVREKDEGKNYVCGLSGFKGGLVLQDINDLEPLCGICNGNDGLFQVA
jgi:hypothetical protein